MKRMYTTFALSLFAVAGTFAQITISYETNVLRPGDVRNLKKIEYQEQGVGGANKVWDFSQSKELGDMVIRQGDNTEMAINNKVNLVCDEGGIKNSHFEITKSKKINWGLENSVTKIKLDKPVVDLKFPFSYSEKINGMMEGVYEENGKTSPMQGNYTTEADAWGTLLLPDGNVYNHVLRIRLEKNYTQKYQTSNAEPIEYQINTVRYQYFAKGVRYPVLIVCESTVNKTGDSNCVRGSKWGEAYYETPAVVFGDSGKDIKNKKGVSLIENFEYSVTPNPFEAVLYTSFSLKKNAKVEINLFDMTKGSIVKQIVNEKMVKGDYTFDTNTSDLITGQYILQVIVDKEVYSTKLVKK